MDKKYLSLNNEQWEINWDNTELIKKLVSGQPVLKKDYSNDHRFEVGTVEKVFDAVLSIKSIKHRFKKPDFFFSDSQGITYGIRSELDTANKKNIVISVSLFIQSQRVLFKATRAGKDALELSLEYQDENNNTELRWSEKNKPKKGLEMRLVCHALGQTLEHFKKNL